MDRIKTKYKGVYYRTHRSRKNGIRPDRYFYLRYTLGGKQREEGYGWESEGFTEAKAAAELETIRANIKTGNGYTSLKQKKEAIAETTALRESATLTFDDFYNQYEDAQRGVKSDKFVRHERQYYDNHIKKHIATKPLKAVTVDDIEKIKQSMLKIKTAAGAPRYAPATVNHILKLCRHIFNVAIVRKKAAENPAKAVKLLPLNNRRLRFFTQEEAEVLLAELRKIHPSDAKTFDYTYYKQNKTSQTYELALVSLYCGCRAGELFQLRANDINFTTGFITVRKSKNHDSRNIPMPKIVADMLHCRLNSLNITGENFVFQDTKGGGLYEISDRYQEIVDKLFNKDISDRQQRAVFHTLRHTYASWLVMAGVDIYTVKELMGHKTLAMTMRYAHLAPQKFTAAISALESHSAATAAAQLQPPPNDKPTS